MFQTSEEQKNEIIDFQKSNKINLCERCKNADIVLICEECSPFHYFCQKCDSIIHQLPSRLNHIRQNAYENISNKLLFKCKYNNKSASNILLNQKISEEKINNLINDVNKEISNENEFENINENYLNDNKDNFDFNIRYLTESKSNKSNNNINFTKNKYNNLKSINVKKHIFPQIATSNSSKNIKTKKYFNTATTYANKKFNEQLKMIYEGRYKYMTLNNEKNTNKNFDMPKLLEDRKIPLFKKNNKLFLSPLHFSKFEQMNEIKNKLVKAGILDKEIFKIYNKNV